MRVSALLFLTWMVVTWPVPADACSCVFGSGDLATNLREALDSADAVFHGRVVSVERSGGFLGLFGRGSPEATFEVIERFKGSLGTKVVLPSSLGGGSCESQFKTGDEYLVYAFMDEGHLVTTLCSRTRPITPSTRRKVELDWLRTGRLPLVPVALQRETVQCQTCNLDTVTSNLVGLPPGNTCNLGLQDPEAAIALREGRPFWTGGYYNWDDPTRMTAVGLSRELRPFELIQTPDASTDETCRQRVSLRWCERLEASSAKARGQPELRCINPGPEQEVCDETKSRTAVWGPKESLQTATCTWNTPDMPTCELQKELQPLAEKAPTSPLLVCSPANGLLGTYRCRVVAGDAAP
ncbi:hypothetical protein ACN28E_12175 [Archangium lansingense]|uniref:hypothetical protein n=1 Tax=Archangium lansingense TaxID=2995310 RepID=UPI003B7DFD1C